MTADQSPTPEREDVSPRRGLWASLPKRSLSRVVLLLAMLAGILFLRDRTGSIADCMSRSFEAPPPAKSGARVRLFPLSRDGGR